MKSIQNSEIRQKGEGAGRSLQCPTGAKGIQGSPEEIYLVRLTVYYFRVPNSEITCYLRILSGKDANHVCLVNKIIQWL